MKLFYILHKLRIVSVAPSLWRQFVWPQYDCRENTSMMNVLKACGSYVKCLAFPGDYCNGDMEKELPWRRRIHGSGNAMQFAKGR